jgi:serine/threonine-protein kinase ATR
VHDEIRTTAFSAWKTMIRSLDDEDVGPLLETTFSTIILKWAVFDSTSRLHATELLTYLLKQRHDLVREFIDLIPSLDQIPELAEPETEVKKMRAEIDVRQHYRTFSLRIGHEHESVVTQAMIELAKYLRQHQSFLQASAVSEQPDSVVGELLRSILDACVKFSEGNPEIARLSAECIGLIGCLDSNRVEAIRDRKEVVIVSNFDDPTETTEFVLFLLENVIVKAFLSATDPRVQGFLSYAMQELLEKCDIKEACMVHRKGMEDSATESIYLRWLKLPEIVRQTLTPFLKSRYKVGELAKSEAKYPIFEHTKKYTAWLRVFVLDLLKQPHNPNAMIIFAPLCRVIKIEDISVASFLLPFVVLHAVVLGTDEQRGDIRSELLRVLSHQAPPESHFERTNTKLCSEVSLLIGHYSCFGRLIERLGSFSYPGLYVQMDARKADEIEPEKGL